MMADAWSRLRRPALVQRSRSAPRPTGSGRRLVASLRPAAPDPSRDRDHRHHESVAFQGVRHPPDRRVLHGAGHDAVADLPDGAHPAPDGQRDRLGAARREDDLIGLGSDPLGDRGSRIIQEPPGRATLLVETERVPERVQGVQEGPKEGAPMAQVEGDEEALSERLPGVEDGREDAGLGLGRKGPGGLGPQVASLGESPDRGAGQLRGGLGEERARSGQAFVRGQMFPEAGRGRVERHGVISPQARPDTKRCAACYHLRR